MILNISITIMYSHIIKQTMYEKLEKKENLKRMKDKRKKKKKS